jgi:hypothetical protein
LTSFCIWLEEIKKIYMNWSLSSFSGFDRMKVKVDFSIIL